MPSKEYNDDNPWRNEDTLRRMYWEDNMSLPQIATEFDITHQAILYWFDKHDIPTREITDYPDEKYANDAVPSNIPQKSAKQTILCANCGELYPVRDSKLESRRYCSRECYDAGRYVRPFKREWRECQGCEMQIPTTPSIDRKFCSHDCYSAHVDEGKKPLKEVFRQRETLDGWRDKVFQRDEYTCQECGETGGRLEAHHKVPVSEIVEEIDSKDEVRDHELFCDLANGETLCESCHYDHHTNGDQP